MNAIPAISAPAAMSPSNSTLLVFEVDEVDSFVVVLVGVVGVVDVEVDA